MHTNEFEKNVSRPRQRGEGKGEKSLRQEAPQPDAALAPGAGIVTDNDWDDWKPARDIA